MATSHVRFRALAVVLGAMAWVGPQLAWTQQVMGSKEIAGGLKGHAPTAASPVDSNDEGIRGFSVKPLDTPDPMPPRAVNLNIPFEINSDRLQPGASRQLDELAAALSDPALISSNVEIVGHTDSSGAAAYNLRLSQKRAEAVRSYLVTRKGIDAGRITPVGRGEEEPVPGTDPAAPQNRRVEVRLVNDGQRSP